jgi:ABC-type proline/glycine betaine transport system permease subunit
MTTPAAAMSALFRSTCLLAVLIGALVGALVGAMAVVEKITYPGLDLSHLYHP